MFTGKSKKDATRRDAYVRRGPWVQHLRRGYPLAVPPPVPPPPPNIQASDNRYLISTLTIHEYVE